MCLIHFQQSWADQYESRTLNAYSAAPLIVYPTHYTGDEGYISDTEESDIIFEDQSEESNVSIMKSEIEVGINLLTKDEL